MSNYPKTWPTGGGGSESGVRALQNTGQKFGTKAGQGYIARLKGIFSEVITDEPDSPNWFSFSTSRYFALVLEEAIHVTGAAVPRGTFSKRGELPNQLIDPLDTNLVYPSGAGWALVVSNDHSVPHVIGLGTYFASKMFNGQTSGKSTQVPKVLFRTALPFGMAALGFQSWYGQTAYNGSLLFLTSHAGFVLEGLLTVQKPYVDGFFLQPDKTWAQFSLPMPLNDFGKYYTVPRVLFLTPQVLATWYAEAGELARLWITLDLGTTWIEQPAGALFPGLSPVVIPPGVDIDTIPGVQDLANAAGFYAFAISLRKMVIVAAYAGGTTITLYDIFTGSVLNQWLYPSESWGAYPIGQGSWGQYRDLDRGAVFHVTPSADNLQTTVDFGATFQSWSPAAGDFSAVGLVIGAKVYYVTNIAGAKHLFESTDLYATAKDVAVLGTPDPVLGEYAGRDYDQLLWVGTPAKSAPMDTTFPWRIDSRVGIPEWWYDGILH